MTKKQKKVLGRIIIASILFGIAFFTPINETINIVLYFGAYLIIGHDVVIKAVRNIFAGELFDENFFMALATVVAIIVKDYPEAVAVMLFY